MVRSIIRARRPEQHRLIAFPSYDLLPQMPPVGGPGIATSHGPGRHGQDLVHLAARDFDFHGGIQKIGRIHDELERFSGRKDRPHAGSRKPGFITRNRHRVEPALIEVLDCQANECTQDRSEARKVFLIQEVLRLQAPLPQASFRECNNALSADRAQCL